MVGRRLFVVFVAIGVAAFVGAGNVFAAPAPLIAGQNVLAAGNYNDGTSSSDLSLILQLSADGVALVDEGAAVKYIVPTAEIPNCGNPTSTTARGRMGFLASAMGTTTITP